MKTILPVLLLFVLPVICGAQIAGPQPERELESFLDVLSADDLRNLQRAKEFADMKPISDPMCKLLEKTELGKKVRLRMTCGGYLSPGVGEFGPTVRNLSSEDKARKKGSTVQVQFNISAAVPKGRDELVKQCREGRRIYVTGTIKDISISSGKSLVTTSSGGTTSGPIVVNLSISIAVEDMTPNK